MLHHLSGVFLPQMANTRTQGAYGVNTSSSMADCVVSLITLLYVSAS